MPDGPRFLTPDGLPAPPGYSHVVVAPSGGRTVWVSGQVAFGADGSVVGAGDWERQTRQAFANTATALAAAGATWADVVKLTFFVTSVAEIATVRAVRDEFVDAGRPPASSLVQVAGLVHPDLLIEVEATAWLPDLAP